MSLVCYGSSDSEEEPEENQAISESKEQSNLKSDRKNISDFEEKSVNKERNIPNFTSIPKPAPKKGRETVKITIPSLDQFKEEEIKIESKAQPVFKGGSGLLSMLPPPKYSGSTTQPGLTPHVLTKQKKTEKKVSDVHSLSKKFPSTGSVKPTSISKAKHFSESISTNNDEKEEEDETSFDFFSLESVNKKIDVEENTPDTPSHSTLFSSLPEPAQSKTRTPAPIYQEPSSSSTTGPFTSFSSVENENYLNIHNSNQAEWTESYRNSENVAQASADPQVLDEEFKKMLGRKKEDIQFIDVNADDQLTGKEQWLMQSLTEEKIHRPSKRKGEMPTQQQKRKHQITYLAFQAKERELDLKNQWSLNRRTKRETQAKYGF